MEKLELQLPAEVQEMAKSVSLEKRTEVQKVLNSVFNGVSKMREQIESINVENENDKFSMNLAKTSRLAVRSERLEAEKTIDSRRSELAEKMRSDKTEDSLWLKSKQIMQIMTKELEEMARWKEETAKRFEAERIELEMQSRLSKVQKFNPEITISEVNGMSSETFEMFLSGVEKSFNDKVEAENKAEEERIAKEKAEAERIEAQRIENARLKAEAEAREKEIELERIERAKLDAERIAKENKERLEREALEAKNKAEAEAKLKLEREAREKLQAEAEAKKQAELKSIAEAEAREQAELSKGDAAKIQDLINDLKALKTKYEFKSAKNKKKYADVSTLIDKVINHINN